MVGGRTVTVTCLLHQPGYEEIHWSHQLQREDLQHFHAVWKVYLLWQWRRDGVRVEYRHRWGWRKLFESIFCCHLTPLSLSLSLVQAMWSPSTLSSVTSLLSMAWRSTLMKTWLPSVPLASDSLSTRTCTTAKVCLNCQIFQKAFSPVNLFTSRALSQCPSWRFKVWKRHQMQTNQPLETPGPSEHYRICLLLQPWISLPKQQGWLWKPSLLRSSWILCL